MKRFIAALLCVLIATSCLSFNALAATTTVEDGVVIVTDSSKPMTRYVYYPESFSTSTSKYPVIVWANGTGCKPAMYADLFKGFARQGFIVIVSDETMAADGTDQIAGLDYILSRSSKKGDAFYNRIDSLAITAMGHSQGGRSAVNAAAADERFACVVSLAGSNYQEEAELLSAPALFLTGTSDRMVNSAKWVKPAYDVCKGAACYASLIGASHTACSSEPDTYIPYCTSWIRAWTAGDSTALAVFKSGGSLSRDTAWTDVTQKNLTNNISGKVTLSATEYSYNGKVRKPSVSVKDYRGVKISPDNYTITYDSGRKNVGKYKVTIRYRKKYTGTRVLYFTIFPKPAEIKSIAAIKKGFKATWAKRTAQTDGFELQYATDKGFRKGKKIIKIADKKAASKKVTGLASGKKYYVRLRAYKKAGKVTYYSKWSAAKAVTAKK